MRTENSHSNRNKLTVVPNQAIMAVGSPSPYVIISRNSRVTGIHSTTPTKRRWRRGRLLRMYGRHAGMLLLGRNLFEYVLIAYIPRFDVLVCVVLHIKRDSVLDVIEQRLLIHRLSLSLSHMSLENHRQLRRF